MKTNIELVQFAKKALNENWGYCLGSFGNILTTSFMNQKMSQGGGVGSYNTKHKAYLQKFLNKRVTDCYGLVKAFIWWNNGQVKYVSAQDRNQKGAYNAAKEKGSISTIPEMPGLILWMRGHAGIYIGNGEFIECVGAPVGMRKGKIVNGKVTSGSKFTHWFKDSYIKYEILEEFINLDILGKKVKVPGYFKSKTNYITLDGKDIPIRTVLGALGLTVSGKGNEVVAKWQKSRLKN